MVTLRWGPVLKSFVNGLHAVLQAVAHAEQQLGTPRQEGETHDTPKSQMDVSCMSLLSAICTPAVKDVSQDCLGGQLQMPCASEAACVLSGVLSLPHPSGIHMFPQQPGVL